MDEYEDHKNLRRFPVPVALLLSLWSGTLAILNGIAYFRNTWLLFANLRSYSFALLINPSAWLWFLLVSSWWYAPLCLTFLPWGRYSPEFSRTKVTLLVIFVPLGVSLLFYYTVEYWFPLKFAENGSMYLRFFPFL
jgi:hypothetical protein